MFGLLPRSPYQTLWELLGILCLLLVVWIGFRGRRQSRRANVIQIAIAVALSPFLTSFVPSIERAHREYYEGMDQFEWFGQLRSDDKAVRDKAYFALCQILKRPLRVHKGASTRWWIAQELGECGPIAKPAMPTLIELLADEDEILRDIAAAAIDKIDAAESSRILKDHSLSGKE